MKKIRFIMLFAFAILSLAGCERNIDGEIETGANTLNEQTGETMAPPAFVYTDRNGIIAFIGDIFIEPDGATDITYSYVIFEGVKSAYMSYTLDGVSWSAGYSTDVHYYQRIYHKMEGFVITSVDNYGFGNECLWKGLNGEPEYIYYKYDKDYLENAYGFKAEWYFENTQELYTIEGYGYIPEKIEPEKVFNY